MNARFEPENGLWGNEAFPLTREYKNAVKALLSAQIKMLREMHKQDAESWYCGAATIDNFENSRNLKLTFGGKDDAEEMQHYADIFVAIEY